MPRKRKTPPEAPAGDYAVGYGRPPVYARFKQRRSGNRKGRPTGAANMSEFIEEAMNEKVSGWNTPLQFCRRGMQKTRRVNLQAQLR